MDKVWQAAVGLSVLPFLVACSALLQEFIALITIFYLLLLLLPLGEFLAPVVLNETWQHFLPASRFGRFLEEAVTVVTATAGFTGGYLSSLPCKISILIRSVCSLLFFCDIQTFACSALRRGKREHNLRLWKQHSN